jgi:hypothetical protein
MPRAFYALAAAAVAAPLVFAVPASADVRLLHEAIELPAAALFLGRDIPALVLGRDGRRRDRRRRVRQDQRRHATVPDGDTLIRTARSARLHRHSAGEPRR